MTEASSIFDMIGPIMIGPSSSHTAGVVRIALMTRLLLGESVIKATVTFYNSFAFTYEGHGSDRAVLAGLMGMKPDDDRIRHALTLAKQSGLEYHFKTVNSAPKYHPNSIKIEAQSENNTIETLGVSRGGGLISIREVNGFTADLSGLPHTIMIVAADVKGSIGHITSVISNNDCNIATMTVSRKGKNNDACLIMELDSELRHDTLEYIRRLPWVKAVRYVAEF